MILFCEENSKKNYDLNGIEIGWSIREKNKIEVWNLMTVEYVPSGIYTSMASQVARAVRRVQASRWHDISARRSERDGRTVSSTVQLLKWKMFTLFTFRKIHKISGIGEARHERSDGHRAGQINFATVDTLRGHWAWSFGPAQVTWAV